MAPRHILPCTDFASWPEKKNCVKMLSILILQMLVQTLLFQTIRKLSEWAACKLRSSFDHFPFSKVAYAIEAAIGGVL